MESMQGKIVVVTGASSGIGAAAARALANAGATVAVVGRDKDRTNQVAKECLGNGRAFVADMSSLASVK
jgi:serine 3-dehydrogenase (NADP+)